MHGNVLQTVTGASRSMRQPRDCEGRAGPGNQFLPRLRAFRPAHVRLWDGQRSLFSFTGRVEAQHAPEETARLARAIAAERGFSQGENCFSLAVEKETGFRDRLIGIPKADAAALVSLSTGQRWTGCETPFEI
jgi:hypothetical protein